VKVNKDDTRSQVILLYLSPMTFQANISDVFLEILNYLFQDCLSFFISRWTPYIHEL